MDSQHRQKLHHDQQQHVGVEGTVQTDASTSGTDMTRTMATSTTSGALVADSRGTPDGDGGETVEPALPDESNVDLRGGRAGVVGEGEPTGAAALLASILRGSDEPSASASSSSSSSSSVRETTAKGGNVDDSGNVVAAEMSTEAATATESSTAATTTTGASTTDDGATAAGRELEGVIEGGVADKTAKSGQDNKGLEARERYEKLRQEIELLGRRITGRSDGVDALSSSGDMRMKDMMKQKQDVVESSALVRGMEDAIAGLVNVYKTLKSDELSAAMQTGTRGHGARNDGAGTTVTGRTRTELKRTDDVKSGMTTAAGADDGGDANAVQIRTGLMMTTAAGGARANATRGDVAMTAGRVGVVSGNGSGGAVETGVRTRATEGGKDVEMGEGESGVSALAVLAGLVFVAAFGIMAYGYWHAHEGAGQTAPLYPPRGPSFV